MKGVSSGYDSSMQDYLERIYEFLMPCYYARFNACSICWTNLFGPINLLPWGQERRMHNLQCKVLTSWQLGKKE